MRKLFFFAILLAIFSACQKDDDSNQNDTTLKPDYFPMAIGNYWVYENVTIDSLGVTLSDKIDSVIITKDTLIDNETFYIFEQTRTLSNGTILTGHKQFYRDSSGYIIDSSGAIFFSDENFTNTLQIEEFITGSDTVYITTYKMEYVNEIVSVPAGDFEVLNFKGTVWVPDPNQGVPNPRYINDYFAPNVGKIFENTFFLSSNNYKIERRLLRYNVYLPE